MKCHGEKALETDAVVFKKNLIIIVQFALKLSRSEVFAHGPIFKHFIDLVEFLRGKGYSVFPTREPGGTSIGEQVREVLHSLKNTEMHPRTETLLYQAARAQFVEQIVRPRLAAGVIVLSDRYAESTIAYQGYGHQQDLEQVRALVKYATGGLLPDLTVLLDVAVEIGLERSAQRRAKGGEWNRLDAYTLDFHRRVRAGYMEMVKQEPKRWVVVDAGMGWEDVQKKLRKIITRVLEIN
ncbi:MAG: dTMP kinase [Deltaproteobacteria bacterium]